MLVIIIKTSGSDSLLKEIRGYIQCTHKYDHILIYMY